MLRLADYECIIEGCGYRSELLVEKANGEPFPPETDIDCPEHGEISGEYVISAPAAYLGEKDLSPMVHGGAFDTTGRRALPSIPDLPGAEAAATDMKAELGAIPDSLPAKQFDQARRDVMRKHSSSVPSSADYSAHFSQPEVKETFAERDRVKAENATKRARAKAKKADPNINFRNTRVAGDPNFTS